MNISTTTKFVEEKTANGIFFRKTFTATSKNTLVLIMGYGGSLRIWPATFVERLAKKFIVVTYDNRGTGLSIIPQNPEDYTIAAMAGDVFDVVKLLGVASHHVLGYSMGSCIALRFAHDHQELVQSLFIMSGTAAGSLYAKPAKELSEALTNPQGKTLWEIYMNTFKLMYSPEAFELCLPTFRLMYEASKDLATRPLALAGHSHAFRNFDGTSYLANLKMPTTLLAGRNDRLMPVQNSENLAMKIAGSRLVLLDDCEHGPHIQYEDAVIEEIEKACD